MNKLAHSLSWLRRLVVETVQHPESMIWEVLALDQSVTIEITPHGADYGRISGRQGANIKALKLLGEAIGRVCGKQILISLEDSVVGEKLERMPSFRPAEDWDGSRFQDLLDGLLGSTIPGAVRKIAQGTRTTAIEITCARESLDVADALKIWIRAWGKANGRDITTTIITEDDQDVQPESSDGRFTRAISR